MKRALLSIVLCLAAQTAVAAPAIKGAPPGYEAQYKQVLEAEKNEEYEKALTLLDQIPDAKQNVYTRLKRAGLLVRLGRFVEAEDLLAALLKDPAADSIRPTVQGDIDDLRARMPKLTIRLAASSTNDAWVTVDDKPIGPPVTLPMNPGTHLVIAKKGGVEVFRQKVTLQDGQNLEVEIDTSIAPPTGSVSATTKKPTETTTAVAPPVTDEPTSSSRFSPLPLFIGGGVLVVGSVVSFVVAKSAQSSVESNCRSQMTPGCDTDAAGGSKVRTWETIGWVAGGLGVVALGTGIVLVSTRSNESKSATTIVARPVVGSSAGFSIAGTF